MKVTAGLLFSAFLIICSINSVNAQEAHAVWAHVDDLNAILRSYKADIPPASLEKYFNKAVELSRDRKIDEDIKQLTTGSGSSKELDSYVRRAAPGINVLIGESGISVGPNIGFFVEKSLPGSMENKFFRLANNGYSRHGVYYCGEYEWAMGQGNTAGDSEAIKKDMKEKLLYEWEKLKPGLKGVYLEIADETINRLRVDKQRSEGENARSKNGTCPEEKRVMFEYELDAYYSSVDLTFSLTDEPIPNMGEQSEFEIYKNLFQSSYLPRFVLFEASVNPLPCLGVFLKRNYEPFYTDTEVGNSFNIIEAITSGFEEPYAFSFFMGDVVSFTKPGEKRVAGNNGYMGYLFSIGNYHIKDNVLIDDNWYEIEWKIKGDREYTTQKLKWSFRVGTKVHDNPEITDVYYISLRRSRVDFEAAADDWLKNSGFEYTFDMDKRNFNSVRHAFSVEKKWPLKKRKFAFALTVGMIWETDRKYMGSLKEEGVDNMQVVIWPNIEF